MLCCSTNCEKYETCGRAVGHGKTLSSTSKILDTVESLLYWGSVSYGLDKDGNVDIKENYVCGPSGNWGMYIPVSVETTKPEDLSKYNITVSEEENKDMDNLEVRVKINSYKRKNNSSTVEMDFEKPLYVHSVWANDNLVELEHDGHKFIVTQSELEKAIRACTHNTW